MNTRFFDGSIRVQCRGHNKPYGLTKVSTRGSHTVGCKVQELQKRTGNEPVLRGAGDTEACRHINSIG